MIDIDDLASEIAKGIYGDDRMSAADINAAMAALSSLIDEVQLLRAENRKLRDVLEWVNNQCPGPCGGVCDAVLRGEHRREEAVCAHGNTECRRCGIGPGCGEHRSEREPLEDDSIEYRDIGKED